MAENDQDQAETGEGEAYLALARKYRPQDFGDLIGQEPMVRVLASAFEHDRIHHAFIMTGVRGVGKTTTARIIARGLNCIGPDGKGGPTTTPCGECEPCRHIAEGRHVDVLEMDAASRTGVGDIRELIDSVRYRATSARYKVYVIDEVHMLSTSAFNALLKTLEEPPPHVKFIFATTEIRKVPVTVLSRCQRFDLRRIEPEAMIAHLKKVSEAEGAKIDQGALALITRAAEGSVRDALSLLDQAISHGSAEETTADAVRSMLGLADRGRVIDLFESIMGGEASAALDELSNQYADGADPVAVLRDLAELTHWISIVKINPANAEDPTVGADERDRGRSLAERLEMRALARMWQMLLKALEEVERAPNAMMAAEMAVIRLTHVAELPSPEELIRQIENAPRPPAGPGGGAPSPGGGSGARAAMGSGGAPAVHQPAHAPQAAARQAPHCRSFADVVALAREHRDGKLLMDIEDFVHLTWFSEGRIEFRPGEGAPADLAARLGERLSQWTGRRWMVALSSTGGEATVADKKRAEENAQRDEASAHPLVAAALEMFPGAKIVKVNDLMAEQPEAPPDDEPADEEIYGDDWSPVDPFAG